MSPTHPVGTPHILARGSKNACGHAGVNERSRHGRRVNNTDICFFEDVDPMKSAIGNVSSVLPRESRTFMGSPTTFHLQRTRNFSASLDNDCNMRPNAALLGLPVTSGCQTRNDKNASLLPRVEAHVHFGKTSRFLRL